MTAAQERMAKLRALKGQAASKDVRLSEVSATDGRDEEGGSPQRLRTPAMPDKPRPQGETASPYAQRRASNSQTGDSPTISPTDYVGGDAGVGQPDVVVMCTKCGGPIVAQHFTPSHVSSEYRNGKGECWDCDRGKP